MDLADVLRIIGKAEEAAATAQEALALLEKKGVVPAIAHVKHFVATLAACPGIGPLKLERYGEDILAVIENSG